MPTERTWVIAPDLIGVIFHDMDPVWLKTMWDNRGTTWVDTIEILISLALLKIKNQSV
jgi:hypothetical protein